MAHPEQVEFCLSVKRMFPAMFRGKRVLDVGSLDVNGNNRHLFESCTYLGIDVCAGPNVDRVCRVHDVSERFDVAISTEVLEHDRGWQTTLLSMVQRLVPGGLLIVTCAGPGRPEHGTRKHPMKGMSNDSDHYRNVSCGDLWRELELDTPQSDIGQFSLTYRLDPCDTQFWGFRR